jgi:hypothetical protein
MFKNLGLEVPGYKASFFEIIELAKAGKALDKVWRQARI